MSQQSHADSVDHHICSTGSTGIHGFKASPGIELLDMNSIYGVNNLDQLKIKWISKNGDQQNPDIIG